MRTEAIAETGPAHTCTSLNLSVIPHSERLFAGITFDRTQQKEEKMKPTSKTFTVSTAALLASAFFVMTAPAANAEDYCITNGAQTAHGCGYPTMEACRAASAGMGGYCQSALAPAKANDALAYQPKQSRSQRRLPLREQSGGN